MKRKLVMLVGGILLTGAVMLVALPACGGPSGGTTQVPATPKATATSQPTPTSVPTATVAPTSTGPAGATLPATPQPSPRSAGPSNSDVLAQGKLVFEKTAGGVGCALCHGLDGKGQGTAGLDAPPNRGKTEADVRAALLVLPVMSFIKLSDEEITAVAAYLQWLATQP